MWSSCIHPIQNIFHTSASESPAQVIGKIMLLVQLVTYMPCVLQRYRHPCMPFLSKLCSFIEWPKKVSRWSTASPLSSVTSGNYYRIHVTIGSIGSSADGRNAEMNTTLFLDNDNRNWMFHGAECDAISSNIEASLSSTTNSIRLIYMAPHQSLLRNWMVLQTSRSV